MYESLKNIMLFFQTIFMPKDKQKRKAKKPTPIPLRVVVAYGTRKKVVTISIWGKDKNNIKYVNYPDSIDNIIDAIQKMAVREEES